MAHEKFYAPGHAALARMSLSFPQAGLDVTGLVVEVSDRGDPIQRDRAISYMRTMDWSEMTDQGLRLGVHNGG